MRKFFLGLLLAFIFTNVYTQVLLTPHTYKYDSTKAVTNAKIDDVKWLTGNWQGKGFGGELEEVWTAPKGGTMVATFSMYENNVPAFFEICMIAEEKGSLIYKVKHFNPDLTGWEEKNDYETFPLVKIDKEGAYFGGLTMINHIDSIELYIALRQKDGSHNEEKLMYYRNGVINPPSNYDSASTLLHKKINEDVWIPFIHAYRNGDNTSYLNLHTEDFIRAVGGNYGSIKNKKEYTISSLSNFDYAKNKNQKLDIAFSFLERKVNESTASERGIYRYSVISKDGHKDNYYGKFHVFLRKINNVWKIVVDYDSNENRTIGEDDFIRGQQLSID